jgi:hypothetical protein
MKKALFAIAATALIALGTVATPRTAEARCVGCAVGAGVIGGLAAGAIIGGAIANSQPRYYAPDPGYVAYPAYGVAAPYGCPGGYWGRRPLRDQWGNIVGYSRPRYFCP